LRIGGGNGEFGTEVCSFRLKKEHKRRAEGDDVPVANGWSRVAVA